LVNQLDGAGNSVLHVTIYNLPYLRIQGGSNGIIIDPQEGDIGICVFASRDISNIKTTKTQSPPGSYRQYSFADGMYLGGVLNGTPTQYVQFSTAGIKLHSPVAIVLDAPDIQLNASTVEINGTTSTTITTPTLTINGAVVLNGALSATGDVTAQGTSVHNHKHGGVSTGGSQTGVPV
jgi:phage baseplate assembly protein gpV